MPNGQLITIPCHRELTLGLLNPQGRIDRGTIFGFGLKRSVSCNTQSSCTVLRKADIGWMCRLSPACFSQGETIEEAINNVREAIELHIQGLKDEGQEIPKEEGVVIGRVDVRAA